MVIVSWSVFWFDPPEASRQVTIAVTALLTIIAFALAISLTLPRVPNLTFADGFFLMCSVFAFVTMVELTVVHVAYRNERRKLAGEDPEHRALAGAKRIRRNQFNCDSALFGVT